jgi:hypothetical protein
MSLELLQSSLIEHAKSGKEGLCITVVRKGQIFGVDIHPDWEKDLKERGFEMFAKMCLEPAFCQLENEMEERDAKRDKGLQGGNSQC